MTFMDGKGGGSGSDTPGTKWEQRKKKHDEAPELYLRGWHDVPLTVADLLTVTERIRRLAMDNEDSRDFYPYVGLIRVCCDAIIEEFGGFAPDTSNLDPNREFTPED